MCYNIMHGLVSIPFESFFKLSLQQKIRGHVFYPASRVGVRAHSFPVRVISLWNRLPSSTVLSENTRKFKISLKAIDLSYALLGKK